MGRRSIENGHLTLSTKRKSRRNIMKTYYINRNLQNVQLLTEIQNFEETCAGTSTIFKIEASSNISLVQNTNREIESTINSITEDTCNTNFELNTTLRNDIISGRRLFDIGFLFEQILNGEQHAPFACSVIDMVALSEKRNGLQSTFTLKCKMCNRIKCIETERNETADANHMSINSSVVLGAVSTGIGHSQLEQIAASIDMPMMSDKTYIKQHAQLEHIIYSSVLDTIHEAAKTEVDIAKELGEVDENGIPCITVVADGAWSKRSYNVNYDAPSGVMEGLVREMQDTEHGGVPVRSQKLFLTSIPAAFMGYDLIEWLMERLGIEESEALNIANQLCQYGYFFPISDSKNLVVKDDSSLYRFQNPYYWPWQNRPPDNVEYAIYLAKRTLRNKQRHGLEEYETEAMSNLKKNLANKWDFITIQAEEQVKLSKGLKKADKLVSDSQERAYWRVHRPPPGMISSLEACPVPTRSWNGGTRTRKKTIEDCKREVDLLKNSLSKTRVKVSQALESMVQHVEIYMEYDPLITPTQPSNPWVSEDLTYWQLNSPLEVMMHRLRKSFEVMVKRVDVPTEKRVRRWGLSMEELVSDPTGLQEFTNYLRKEYSHENIRFWMAVQDLRRSAQSQITWKVQEIFEEFLAPGAPCEINIDGKTMEKVHQEMKTPSRFTFDAAQEHVYTLLLKKDCYPRFIRSEYYKNLLATGIQPSQKKRFFGFGQPKKKASTSTAPNQQQLSQHQQASQGTVVMCGALSKRRGSDRSLSGSAHELAISGVKDTKVPHSHSQSNLSDIPYRGDMVCIAKLPTVTAVTARNQNQTNVNPVKKPNIAIVAGASTSEDICPWESGTTEPRSRKNSMALDSGSSSSDLSVAVTELTEKVQRSYILTQQHTLDSGRNLSAHSIEPQRRASVSVPIQHSTPSAESSTNARRKVSSFEDSSAVGSSCSVSSSVASNSGALSYNSAVINPPIASAVFANSDTYKRSDDKVIKTLKKSYSLAKTFSSTAGAPIISVSPVVDDVPREESDKPKQGEDKDELSICFIQEPLAPLAEPDSESPGSELPPSEVGELLEAEREQELEQEGEAQENQEQGEAKSNDVCPWEDEETCKVDTPFVKTYATLGYL